MSRKVWIVLVVLVLGALLVLRVQQEIGKKAVVATPIGGPLQISVLPEVDETSAPDKIVRRPKETAAERRARLVSNEANRDDFKLSGVDIYLYLKANNSNAVSLVTAFEASRDKEFLKAAAAKFPDDPMVQAKVLMHDVFPEERAKWIEALKKSSPDNSLPYLLAMDEAIQNGDLKLALAELAGAKGKAFYDFTAESSRGLEEAYLSAGRDYAEAKMLGGAEITLPHVVKFSAMGRKFVEAAEKAAAAGDVLQQIDYLKANWEMGAHLRGSPKQGVLITDLVGIATQNRSLRAWPADVPPGFLDRPIAEELAANASVRDSIKAGAKMFEVWYPDAPDEELIAYLERARTLGEAEAMKWLREAHPELGSTP